MRAILKTKFICEGSKESFLFLQFRYKSRVYKQPHVEEKQISKLHTKVRPRKDERRQRPPVKPVHEDEVGGDCQVLGGGCVFRVVRLFLH